MAKTDKLISGKVGNTVFYRVGPETRVRSTPAEYSDAKTPEQMDCRSQFMVAICFYRHMVVTPLREVWRVATGGMSVSGYNFFMRLNMKVFKPDGKIADFSRLQLAVGMLQKVNNLRGEVDDRDVVTLTWGENAGLAPARMGDELMVVVLYGDRSFTPVFEEVRATRGEVNAMIQLNRKRGSAAHLYCFFRAEEGKAYSSSQYLRI